MTREEAQIIAQQMYDSQWEGRAVVKIVPDQTIERPYGWIFFSRPEKLLQIKDGHVLLGNCPILVKKTGETIRFPVQIKIEEAIKRYEAGLPFFPKRTREPR